MSYLQVDGIGGALESIGGAASKAITGIKSGLDIWGQVQSNAQVADLARKQASQQQIIQQAPSGGSSFPIIPVALAGGAALVAFMIFMKKRA